MKKYLSVISLFLCLLMLLSSCANAGGAMKITDFYNKSYQVPDKNIQERMDLGSFAVANLLASGDSLAVVNTKELSTDVYFTTKVFSLTDGEEILSFSAGETLNYTVSIINRHLIEVILSDEKNEENSRVKYYDDKGIEIASVSVKSGKRVELIDKGTSSQYWDDYFCLDSCIYQYLGSAWKAVRTLNVGEKIPQTITNRTADFLFEICDSYVISYSTKFKPLSYWQVPDNTASYVIAPLEGGKILAQYINLLPTDAKKYDFTKQSLKFELTTLLINPKNGAEREISVEYLLEESTPVSELENPEQYSKNMLNLAQVTEIKNQKLQNSKQVLLGSNGQIKDIVRFTENQTDENEYLRIGNEYFAVENQLGQIEFLNKNSRVVSTVNADAMEMTQTFLFDDTAVYQFKLNKIYDLDVGYRLEKTYQRSIIIRVQEEKDENVSNYYLCNANGKTLICTLGTVDSLEKEIVFGNDYYYLEKKDGTKTVYDYYTPDGVSLGSFYSTVSVLYQDAESNYLLSYQQDEKTYLVMFR